jgi:Txe/YoeB family toxin of Txe-Axe toxin-antitoxin module
MSKYRAIFEKRYRRNVRQYRSLRSRIDQVVQDILADPYHRTEQLGLQLGGLDLRGCRSARVDRNFRIIFVVCEECRRIPACQYCFCEDLPDNTIIFLSVGPHEPAYAMREPQAEYADA